MKSGFPRFSAASINAAPRFCERRPLATVNGVLKSSNWFSLAIINEVDAATFVQFTVNTGPICQFSQSNSFVARYICIYNARKPRSALGDWSPISPLVSGILPAPSLPTRASRNLPAYLQGIRIFSFKRRYRREIGFSILRIQGTFNLLETR